jgi:hypothetical protein
MDHAPPSAQLLNRREDYKVVKPKKKRLGQKTEQKQRQQQKQQQKQKQSWSFFGSKKQLEYKDYWPKQAELEAAIGAKQEEDVATLVDEAKSGYLLSEETQQLVEQGEEFLKEQRYERDEQRTYGERVAHRLGGACTELQSEFKQAPLGTRLFMLFAMPFYFAMKAAMILMTGCIAERQLDSIKDGVKGILKMIGIDLDAGTFCAPCRSCCRNLFRRLLITGLITSLVGVWYVLCEDPGLIVRQCEAGIHKLRQREHGSPPSPPPLPPPPPQGVSVSDLSPP